MYTSQILEWLALTALCLASAQLTALFLTRSTRNNHRTNRLSSDSYDPVLLFDGDTVLDTTTAADGLLDNAEGETDWTKLVRTLAPRFSTFPSDQSTVQSAGSLHIKADDPEDKAQVLLEWLDGILRVQLLTRPKSDEQKRPDEKQVSALQEELRMLQMVANSSPFPAWQQLDSNTVGWHNTAYASLYQKLHRMAPVPSKPILQTLLDGRPDNGTVRSSITASGSDKTLWFDVTVVRHDKFSMFYLQDVNAVVGAEVAQRNFVQTLAKTFAQLSIGLAIFDRNRQLVLFNPALIDLTSLPADFLSRRPNLLSFFDRLRDNQMMPEPKSYSSWRDQMADLIAAAADGRYQETWSLPSGSVYQVSGRPHPDGAVAFLFEDITAEVTLTRRFRSDLEMSQSMLDNIEDAIAVFSPAGVLTFSNNAYCSLWAVDPERSFAEVTVLDATRDWQSSSRATPIWGEIRDCVTNPENRAAWQSPFLLGSGEQMNCSIYPIHAGATMVAFRRMDSVAPKNIEPQDILTEAS